MSIRVETKEWSVHIKGSMVVIETSKFLSEEEFGNVLKFTEDFLKAYLKRALAVRGELKRPFMLSEKTVGRRDVSMEGNAQYRFRGVEVTTNLPRLSVEKAREASTALLLLLGVTGRREVQEEWIQVGVFNAKDLNVIAPTLTTGPLSLEIRGETGIVKVSTRRLAELCVEGKEMAVQKIQEAFRIFRELVLQDTKEAMKDLEGIEKKLLTVVDTLGCG